MEQVSRVWFTPKQKLALWERWRSGQCVSIIARALQRMNKSGALRLLAFNGGIPPRPRRQVSGSAEALGARGDLAGHCRGVLDPLDYARVTVKGVKSNLRAAPDA